MIDFGNLKYENGLIIGIVQDRASKEVLMCAYMNREALEKTVETGIAHFWSRSRQKLWKKGETSGHLQKVKEIRIDCDMDSVLLLVEQVGGPAIWDTGPASIEILTEKLWVKRCLSLRMFTEP